MVGDEGGGHDAARSAYTYQTASILPLLATASPSDVTLALNAPGSRHSKEVRAMDCNAGRTRGGRRKGYACVRECQNQRLKLLVTYLFGSPTTRASLRFPAQRPLSSVSLASMSCGRWRAPRQCAICAIRSRQYVVKSFKMRNIPFFDNNVFRQRRDAPSMRQMIVVVVEERRFGMLDNAFGICRKVDGWFVVLMISGFSKNKYFIGQSNAVFE